MSREIDMKARAAEERQRWAELQALADADDVAGFYHRYAEYLEWAGAYSNSRKTLIRMARLAAALLPDTPK